MPTSQPDASILVHVFGRTDVGRTREHNEDAFAVADLTRGNATLQPEVRTHVVGDRGTLFMVADGMGGAAAGEIASAMAIEVVMREVTEALSGTEAPSEDDFASAIKKATAAANGQIHIFAQEHPEFRGMGTTATVAGLLGDTLFLAQVGDSRAYLVRNGVGRQITKDQSLMQKLIEAGEITEEEAEHSERRNIILQALGPEANIKVDLTHQQVRKGDILLLCSDGLSGQVRGEELAQIASEESDLVQACKRMIDRANENGGPDNITVIAARFDGEGLASPGGLDDVGHRVFALAADTGQSLAASRAPTPPSNPIVSTGAHEVRRPTQKIITPEEFKLTSSIPDDTAAARMRRSRGTLIAALFLLLFMGLAMWWVFRTAEQVVAPRHTGVATPADVRP